MAATSRLASPFAPFIEGLVATKRACGFSYEPEEAELARFDRFCSERGIAEARIDRDLAMAWAEQRGSEGAVHRAQRISFVRQLALYMVACGIECYVPSHFTPSSGRVVYIPGKDEVRQLLAAADCYAMNAAACRSWVRIGYPVGFRLMYCCGLRISECACLRREDVDLGAGTLAIRQSKGDKDRVVYLADDAAEMCERYWEAVVRLAGTVPAWFFPGVDIRNHITASGIRHKFQQFWAQTGASRLTSRNPTPHSLRHAFVVNRIDSWVEEGADIDEMMPYLSRYLGHVGPTETFYFSLQHERYYLWCPKLGIEMPDGTVASAAFGITNTLSYDGEMLYQTNEKYKAGPADDILRITFARGKDELGRTAHRFIGVFRHDGPKEGDPWTGVDVRVADEIDLSPWN